MNANKEYGFLNSKLNALERRAKNELLKQFRDVPGGLVVKTSLSNAGELGSIPGPRGSHMLRGSPRARTTELVGPASYNY